MRNSLNTLTLESEKAELESRWLKALDRYESAFNDLAAVMDDYQRLVKKAEARVSEASERAETLTE